jgi:hypothetical protein
MRIADAKLHLLIAATSRSERIHREESAIQAELSKFLITNPYSDPWRSNLQGMHTDLVSAIAGRHGNLARQELIIHVESTFNWMIALLSD